MAMSARDFDCCANGEHERGVAAAAPRGAAQAAKAARVKHQPNVVRTEAELPIAEVYTGAYGTLQIRWANRHDTSPIVLAALVDGKPQLPPVGPLCGNWPTPEGAALAAARADGWRIEPEGRGHRAAHWQTINFRGRPTLACTGQSARFETEAAAENWLARFMLEAERPEDTRGTHP